VLAAELDLCAAAAPTARPRAVLDTPTAIRIIYDFKLILTPKPFAKSPCWEEGAKLRAIFLATRRIVHLDSPFPARTLPTIYEPTNQCTDLVILV
jgi:hypothetical protein